MRPSASAGWITSFMCWAREANIRASSASGESPAVAVSSSRLRIFSPVAVPPGSRVTVTEKPSARSTFASFSSCVLLPQPSRPSKVMKRPRWVGEDTRQIIAFRNYLVTLRQFQNVVLMAAEGATSGLVDFASVSTRPHARILRIPQVCTVSNKNGQPIIMTPRKRPDGHR